MIIIIILTLKCYRGIETTNCLVTFCCAMPVSSSGEWGAIPLGEGPGPSPAVRGSPVSETVMSRVLSLWMVFCHSPLYFTSKTGYR